MKNSYYQNTKEGLAQYICDRKPIFTVAFSDDTVKLNRIGKGSVYKSILTGISHTNINVKINILFSDKLDKIRICIPERTYILKMKYEDSSTFCSFSFTMSQTCSEITKDLAAFVEDPKTELWDFDKIISNSVEKIIKTDIKEILNKNVVDDKKEWLIKVEQKYKLKITQNYLFDC